MRIIMTMVAPLCFIAIGLAGILKYSAHVDAAPVQATEVVPLEDKCAIHSEVAGNPTKYVEGVGCYEKRFHRWELVQFPED